MTSKNGTKIVFNIMWSKKCSLQYNVQNQGDCKEEIPWWLEDPGFFGVYFSNVGHTGEVEM